MWLNVSVMMDAIGKITEATCQFFGFTLPRRGQATFVLFLIWFAAGNMPQAMSRVRDTIVSLSLGAVLLYHWAAPLAMEAWVAIKETARSFTSGLRWPGLIGDGGRVWLAAIGLGITFMLVIGGWFWWGQKKAKSKKGTDTEGREDPNHSLTTEQTEEQKVVEQLGRAFLAVLRTTSVSTMASGMSTVEEGILKRLEEMQKQLDVIQTTAQAERGAASSQLESIIEKAEAAEQMEERRQQEAIQIVQQLHEQKSPILHQQQAEAMSESEEVKDALPPGAATGSSKQHEVLSCPDTSTVPSRGSRHLRDKCGRREGDSDDESADSACLIDCDPVLRSEKPGRRIRKAPRIPLTQEEKKQLAEATFRDDVELVQDNMKEADRERREAALALTEEEKEMTTTALLRKWREEKEARRLGPMPERFLTVEERQSNAPALERKFAQERRDARRRYLQERGIEFYECDSCGCLLRDGQEHRCLRGSYRGPQQRVGGVPLRQQVIVKDSPRGVSVTHHPTVDASQLRREASKMQKTLEQVEGSHRNPLHVAFMAPIEQVIREAPTAGARTDTRQGPLHLQEINFMPNNGGSANLVGERNF